uniref:Uncharacterized protein n=1 Tax=viral metagenome TaxID=1070528 RepID=A0A6C0HDT1_9ZZZZ
MSVIKYIDIDSTYRDRLRYPKVGDFSLQINSKPTDSPNVAQDPVILAFPFETGLLQAVAAGPPVVYQLSTSSSNVNNYYINQYLEVGGLFAKIIAYNGTTKNATLDMYIGGAANDTYTVRKQLPYPLVGSVVGPPSTPQDFQDVTTVNSVTFEQVKLGAAASVRQGEYNNKYLFFNGVTAATPVVPGTVIPPSGYIWRRITNYMITGAGEKIATVYPPLPAIVLAGTVYEIMDFSYDNNKPLIYSGTSVFGNAVCEKLRLINLIVPVLPIEGSNGGTILNYPYVYVSLYSESSKTWNTPLEGNNPLAKNSLFKVPITFNSNYADIWVTLQGSLMQQNISFRENDNLHITIYLPDGTILNFDPTPVYFYFPTYPFPILSNPGKQIQAVFEVIREEKCC